MIQGGEDEKERLETLVDNFIGESFWQKRNRNPDHIARLTRRAREMSSSDLHNIYQGRPDSWQLGESVADFLRRLPPLATPESFSPWIWVANPYANGRDRSSRAQNVVGELTIRGKKLLEESLLERDNIRKANSQSKGKANRLLNQESENLNERITQLAVELNVLSGKVRFSTIEFLDTLTPS